MDGFRKVLELVLHKLASLRDPSSAVLVLGAIDVVNPAAKYTVR